MWQSIVHGDPPARWMWQSIREIGCEFGYPSIAGLGWPVMAVPNRRFPGTWAPDIRAGGMLDGPGEQRCPRIAVRPLPPPQRLTCCCCWDSGAGHFAVVEPGLRHSSVGPVAAVSSPL